MTNELAIRESFDLPDRYVVKDRLIAVNNFQKLVKESLREGHDFGKIPGTQSPTLLKPGAEKIAKLMGLSDHYEIVEKVEDWDKGLFSYTVKASLISMNTGEVVSEGLGECNTYESKYRYRWVWPNQAEDLGYSQDERHQLPSRRTSNGGVQYRVENDDLYSLRNTVLKMGKKRALVDASLSAGRLSDIFTQDIEEMAVVTERAEPESTNNTPSASSQRRANRSVPLKPPFKDAGQFFTAAQGRFGKNRTQVLQLLGGVQVSDIDFKGERDWNTLVEILTEPPTDDGPNQATDDSVIDGDYEEQPDGQEELSI